jgi:hypothetical protein
VEGEGKSMKGLQFAATEEDSWRKIAITLIEAKTYNRLITSPETSPEQKWCLMLA